MIPLVLVACGGPVDGSTTREAAVTCPGEGDYAFADRIVEAPGTVDSPSAVNEPEYAVDGVVEGAPKTGSTKVFSRGLSTDPPNNFVILEWTGRTVVDAAGPDIVVFENAFETQGSVFMDPAVVEVSDDGERWLAFPHDYVADDETTYSSEPLDWEGFAGTTPVRWKSTTCTDPFAESAGGDRFDLADLPDSSMTESGIRFIRITSAASVPNPDTGENFPKYFLSDGFDLDGVYAAQTTEQGIR